MAKAKRKLAVFDIDGTVFRGSLMVELMKSLVFYKVFPKEVTKMVTAEYYSWVNRKGTYQDYINKAVIAFNKYISGCKKKDVVDVSRKVIDYFKDRQYVYTRDLIKKIRKTHLLLSISGSPSEVVSQYNKHLKFDYAYGTEFEEKNGKFTGRRIIDAALEKEKIFNKFISQNNINLQGSIGVGDTEGDINFLNKVTIPIAFNPNANLEKVARKKGWKIVVERKDVIYNIT